MRLRYLVFCLLLIPFQLLASLEESQPLLAETQEQERKTTVSQLYNISLLKDGVSEKRAAAFKEEFIIPERAFTHPNLKGLILKNGFLPTEKAQGLVTVLKRASSLEKISIKWLIHDRIAASYLAQGIKELNFSKKLTKLNLKGNYLGNNLEVYKDLAEGIRRLNSLRSLNLSFLSLDISRAQILFPILSELNRLEKINLLGNPFFLEDPEEASKLVHSFTRSIPHVIVPASFREFFKLYLKKLRKKSHLIEDSKTPPFISGLRKRGLK